MCLSKRWITNPYTHKRLYVSCGKCPACLQQKADKRAQKIRYSVSPDEYSVFAHLTYANDHIPYISKSDAIALAPNKKTHSLYLPIYRDADVKYVRSSSDYKFVKKDSSKDIIDKIFIPSIDHDYFQHSVFDCVGLSNGSPNNVGVLLYSDVQRFIKRLRQRLRRNFGITASIKYFCVGEYGSRTLRPHFHIIFILPLSVVYSSFAAAVAAAWPYDDYDLTRRNIGVAKSAAAYCSSYVNCASYVPALLLMDSKTRPLHHASQNFGISLPSFSFRNVVDAFYRKNLRYDIQVNRKGAFVTESRVYPSYLIRRFFPKFKGYYLLSDSEIFDVFKRPALLGNPIIKERLALSDEDSRSIRVRLAHKIQYASLHGVDPSEFAYINSRIHSLRTSHLYEDSFKDIVSPINYFEAYDNIGDFYSGDALAPTLDGYVGDIIYPETDPNLFLSNLAENQRLTERYFIMDKSHKTRGAIFYLANSQNLKFHF